MGKKKKSGPFSGQRIDSSSKRNSFPTFFVIGRISTKNETFHGVSPFLVEKAITSGVGEVKSTKTLPSGDLLVEVESPKQAKNISKMKSLSTIPVTTNYLNILRQDICAFLLGHIYQIHSAVSSASVSGIRKLLAAGH
ncbi:hypothetical protein AVEN_185233-1 [Araneus ventricosus]|uniref:Uncharacterized protein n=1 Tax=Araneus ventricosus TaxID=182803 RepID=A0A4Y2P317_ARAVE|nr:hypothetical protein AVEN_185233-1 [Araneus ventricosus]